jgi:hypothetical protein
MGSDDGVQQSELLSFWTLFIVQYSKKLENNVSETGSVSVLRSGGGGRTPSQLSPLERANLSQSHLITIGPEAQSISFSYDRTRSSVNLI